MNKLLLKILTIGLTITTAHASVQCAMVSPVQNNVANVLRVLQSKEAMASYRIGQLEDYIKTLPTIDSMANFSALVSDLRQTALESVQRLERLEKALQSLEQIDRDRLTTDQRIAKLEEYIATLEKEAGHLLPVL